jgi:hypothetical protein
LTHLSETPYALRWPHVGQANSLHD